MKLSPAGVRLIAGFEGCVLHPYNDSSGFATIGYGHLLHRSPFTEEDVSRWRGFTRERALELLAADAGSFAVAVTELVRVRLGVIPARAQARFDALASFAFNIGAGAFGGSHVLELVNAKGAPRDWHEPALAMLAWCHDQHGNVVPGLLARRRVESAALVAGRLPR